MAATQAVTHTPNQAGGPQAFWTANHDVVDRAVRIVSRRRRLDADEECDLQSELWLKLLSSATACVKFNGRSSLTTYLVSIADRVLLDMRIKTHGKWRPCRVSRQAGPAAIEFDRLVRRDGHRSTQAIEALKAKGQKVEARVINFVLSRPLSRRMYADVALLERLPSSLPGTDHLIDAGERRAIANSTVLALSHALTLLPPDDRALLHRRFVKGETVASIAGGDRRRQKRTYRRLEGVLSTLRGHLAGAGISYRDVQDVLVADFTTLDCGCGFVGERKGTAPARA